MESESTTDQIMAASDVRRLLVVERSASMRQVLARYLTSQGHEPVLIESYATALDRLNHRFDVRHDRLDAVLFGWPTVMDPDAEACLQALVRGDHADLPVVILSTDMRAETRAWASTRPGSALLAWKDYQRSPAALDDLLRPPVDPERAGATSQQPLSLLLIDDDDISRKATAALWAGQGHTVKTAVDAAGAIDIARSQAVDIVLVDFQWNAQRGDALCRQLVDDPKCRQGAVVMLLDHPVGHQIARCLQAGAVECFYRSESNRLQLARITALGRLLGRTSRPDRQLEMKLDAEPELEPDVSPHTLSRERQRLADIARRAGWETSAVPVLGLLESRDLPTADGDAGHYLLALIETQEDIGTSAARMLAGTAASVARVAPRQLLVLLDAPEGYAGYQKVRRIMQSLNAPGETGTSGAVSCQGSVLAPPLNPGRDLVQLLALLIKGLDVIRSKEPDAVLLLDVKRLLSVYP